MLKKKILEGIEITMIILLIIFGLIVLYQIVLKIFGGSWQTEALIIAVLMLNLGITFSLAVNQVKTNMKINHLSNQFRHLANDFKSHLHE